MATTVSRGLFYVVDTVFPALFLSLDALLLLCRFQQVSSGHVNVSEPTCHKEPVGVFHKTSVTHPGKAENPFKYQERMLHLRPNLRFCPVPRSLFLAQWSIAATLLLGKISGIRRLFTYRITLAGVGRVAPHSGLIAMEKVRKHLAVVYVRRSGRYRMDQLGTAVYTDVGLHAEIPLLSLLRLMHLRVPFLPAVLCRGGSVDDGGVNYGTSTDLHTVFIQILGNQRKELFAEVVSLEKVAKLADRRLVRSSLPAKVDADKCAHGTRVVKGLFYRRIGQVEPMLQKVDAQHAFYTNRRPAGPISLGIERLDDIAKLPPRDNLVHLGEKTLPTGRFAVLFKGSFGESLLTHYIHLRAA